MLKVRDLVIMNLIVSMFSLKVSTQITKYLISIITSIINNIIAIISLTLSRLDVCSVVYIYFYNMMLFKKKCC